MKMHSNIPFAPGRFPIYYGWIILAAGTIGVLISIPGQTMGVSVFTENLLSDLEIDRNYLSLAYLIGTVGSGLLITRAGKFYDRLGARIMGLVAGGMLGLALLYLTRVQGITRYLHRSADWISPALATFVLLAFGFWGIRFFGQGMLTMVSRNMVMKWFDKRRGLANAILGIFSAFGFALAPKILNVFIERRTWSGAWLLLGFVIGLGFVLFVFVFYRDNPEDCGLQADGNRLIKQNRKRPPSLPPRDYSLPEAKKTFAFWVFTLGLSIAALYISGLTFHIISVFKTVELGEDAAIGIFVPAALIAIVIQFISSYLSDFIRLKYLLLVFLAGMALTTTGLIILSDSPLPYWMVVSGNGVTWGLFTVLIAVVWPRFYGLKHLGAISGYSLSWTVIASALGPYLFSKSLDLIDNYDLIGYFSLTVTLVLFVLAFRADNPNEPILQEKELPD